MDVRNCYWYCNKACIVCLHECQAMHTYAPGTHAIAITNCANIVQYTVNSTFIAMKYEWQMCSNV